ncbi:MAG: 50S ribosomal protein L13 [Candidatus Levybacteria bacterium CG10_big_fil_rev_8_21_14_0_10_36_7]|nr:MAG: 50S ribosomal protein L13 [Candidatus Levybacteria bacterium CG10_big_fil_rev_8_21_14_0_10_36_7]
MKKMTQPTTVSQITRTWHLVDVKGQALGRTATIIAQLLMGKKKPYFAKNMDCGDNVVVINAKEVVVTGNKEKKKKYTRYSGYPGGLKTRTFEELMKLKPEQIIKNAVSGMLPKNKLQDEMLKRLYVFPEEKHNLEDKFNKE